MSHWKDFLDLAAPRGDYLPWKVVARRTSLSRTTAWRLQRRDEFPRAHPISPGRVGYLECEVEAWIASRAARRSPTPASPTDGSATPSSAPCRPTAPTDDAGTPRRESPARPTPLVARKPSARRPRRETRTETARRQQLGFDF